MEAHITPKQEDELSQIATHAGMNTEHFVKDTAFRKPTRAISLTTTKCVFGWSSANAPDAHSLDVIFRRRPPSRER
jgi:hypothetical protein